MRPFPTLFLAVQGLGDSHDSGSCHCHPVPILVGCQLQAWCIHPCQVGNCGDLCFLQQLVSACPSWAVLVTWGFVPSTSHAHTKKRKLEVEKRELCGFWRVSVLQRVLAWGAVAGRAGVGPAGTGGGDGDPAPSQPGWCCGMRPLTMLKEEGWLEPDHDACCCGLGCGAVSCERDSSVGTAGIAWEPARMGRGAMSLTRAGGPNVPLAGNCSLFSRMFFK